MNNATMTTTEASKPVYSDPFADDETGDPFADDAPSTTAQRQPVTVSQITGEKPAMQTTHSNGQTASSSSKVHAAAQATAALLKMMETASPAIDEGQVREIVQAETAGMVDRFDAALRDMVDAAIREQAPARVIITVGEYVSKEMDSPLPINFYRVVKLLNARQNTALIGPSGSGKTHTARLAAEALDLRFASLSVTAGMSEGALMGRLLPTGDGGKFEYATSQFVDFYENGGVFLLDEMDAADPNTLLVINTALANGHMAVPSRIDKPEATRHPDFVCIAAANTYGNGADRQYVGREQLDAATLDRFRAGIVTCDYDSNVESTLVEPELLTWARAMREKIAGTRLRRFVSTRFLLDGTKLLATKMATRAALMDSYFADWTADERAKVGDLCPAEPYDIIKDHARQ